MKDQTLLVVDDEESIVEIIVEKLESKVSNILTASNGQEALSIIISNSYIDCVISDIKMPVLTGVELLKIVRQREIEVPFIFYSGLGDDEIIKEAVKHGVFDFISKPSLDNLQTTILRGLSTGFKIRKNDFSNNDFMNDYQKLFDLE